MSNIFEFKANKNMGTKICCGVSLGCALYVSFHDLFIGLGLAVISVGVTYSILSGKGGWFSSK
jgi:hypothetical protein